MTPSGAQSGPRIPLAQPRPLRRLGVGSDFATNFSPGTAFINNGILWALVPVFGSGSLSVRIKTATAGGTLALLPVGPDFKVAQPQDTAFASLEGTIYSTGDVGSVTVTAGTEAIATVGLLGEGFILVKFTGGGTGTITYCDVAQAPESASDISVTGSENLAQVGGAAVTAGAGAVAAGTQRVTLASDDPAVSALGAPTGAAVTTDANGTIQQFVRGLVKLWAAITIKAASTAAVAADPALVVAISPNNSVTIAGTQGAFTDRSGTVTSGGTAQQIAAANASRKYLTVQNVSDTDLWLNIGVTAVATQPSFRLLANGGSVTWETGFIPTGLVSVIGATTGKAFTAKEA